MKQESGATRSFVCVKIIFHKKNYKKGELTYG